MRLTRGGWVLLGFGLTIGVIWAGANIWILIEEQNNGDHLTRIERIVVGLNRARKAPARGGEALQPADIAGQQPSPGQSAGHQVTPDADDDSAPHAHAHKPKGGQGGDDEEQPKDEAVSPTSTGNSAGQAEPAGPPATEEEAEPEKATAATSPGVIGNPGGQLGETVCAAGEVVKELAGIQVCSKP